MAFGERDAWPLDFASPLDFACPLAFALPLVCASEGLGAGGLRPMACEKDTPGCRRMEMYKRAARALNALWQVLMMSADLNFAGGVPSMDSNGTDTAGWGQNVASYAEGGLVHLS